MGPIALSTVDRSKAALQEPQILMGRMAVPPSQAACPVHQDTSSLKTSRVSNWRHSTALVSKALAWPHTQYQQVGGLSGGAVGCCCGLGVRKAVEKRGTMDGPPGEERSGPRGTGEE